ncbi:hypothetical protein J7M23_03205, partial [Candidatus Sumerlaeota bacterium]|nr:hypothetical protein [Candidatus Sumerlaeota bacterium]
KPRGYRPVVAYLLGKTPLEKTIRLINRDTRHYAKRQLTWFRGMPEAKWILISNSYIDNAFAELEKDLLAIYSANAI